MKLDNMYNMYNLKNLMKLDAPDDKGGSGGGTNPEDDKDKKDEPMFTQEQVNGIVASEKKKNFAAAYKDLGFDSAEDAKAFIDKYQKEEDAKKDDLQKAQEEADKAKKDKTSADEQVIALQNKLTAISEGCDPKTVDDVVTLAMTKVNDNTDFKAALEEVKKQYPTMFGGSSNGGGTGHGSNPPRSHGGDDKGIGARLAENVKKNTPKNEYFSN